MDILTTLSSYQSGFLDLLSVSKLQKNSPTVLQFRSFQHEMSDGSPHLFAQNKAQPLSPDSDLLQQCNPPSQIHSPVLRSEGRPLFPIGFVHSLCCKGRVLKSGSHWLARWETALESILLFNCVCSFEQCCHGGSCWFLCSSYQEIKIRMSPASGYNRGLHNPQEAFYLGGGKESLLMSFFNWIYWGDFG